MTNAINFTEAIKQGIITFEQACELQKLTAETALTPKAETPKAETPKAKAPKAETPKAETPKAETPKAETPKAEFPYTKGGCVIQYADKNTLKGNHLRRVNNAMQKLVKAGFCVSWKRVGSFVYITHSCKADKKTRAEFGAVALASGWRFSNKKGYWFDCDMLKDYADNMR